MGMALGAGITYMLRRGPSGRRPIVPALEGAGRGLKWAGTNAWKAGSRGAKWAGEQGEELWERVPREEISRGMQSARDSMEDMVESELRSMRKALRRKRQQLGI